MHDCNVTYISDILFPHLTHFNAHVSCSDVGRSNLCTFGSAFSYVIICVCEGVPRSTRCSSISRSPGRGQLPAQRQLQPVQPTPLFLISAPCICPLVPMPLHRMFRPILLIVHSHVRVLPCIIFPLQLSVFSLIRLYSSFVQPSLLVIRSLLSDAACRLNSIFRSS